MAFEHPYGEYNVEGTLNAWFQTTITARGNPAWMPSARVLFDRDTEQDLISGYSGHAFTVDHLGPEQIGTWQGRNVGGALGWQNEALMEVNCWVSKDAVGAAHPQRLRQMGDLVKGLFASARSVEITHVYGSLTAPTGIGNLIRLYGVNEFSVGNDPNPDLRRRRFLARYQWVERVTG